MVNVDGIGTIQYVLQYLSLSQLYILILLQLKYNCDITEIQKLALLS